MKKIHKIFDKYFRFCIIEKVDTKDRCQGDLKTFKKLLTSYQIRDRLYKVETANM